MKKFLVVSALAVAGSAGMANAQAIDNSIQAVLRFVQLSGAYSSYTYAGTANTSTAVTGTGAANRTRTFAVQYTLLATQGANTTTFPAGLVSGPFDLTGPTATWSYTQLTKPMAQTGGTTPIVLGSSDTGATTGGAATGNPAFGLTKPFRGGLNNAGDNLNPANGIFAGGGSGAALGTGISTITPVTITQTLTNASFQDANTLANLNNYFNLYVFTVVIPDGFSGDFAITASFQTDPGSDHTRFGYFDDGISVPNTSNNAVDAVVHISVPAVPAPASAALLGLGGLVATRRRRA